MSVFVSQGMRSGGGVGERVSFPVPDEGRLVGCWEHFALVPFRLHGFRVSGRTEVLTMGLAGARVSFPVPDEGRLVGCWEHFVLVRFRLHGFRVFTSDGGVDDGVGARVSFPVPDEGSPAGCWGHFDLFIH